MYERYNEDARRTIFYARDEAEKYGSQYIESEHLLLAILRSDQGLDTSLWAKYEGVDSIRTMIDSAIIRATPIKAFVEIPFSQESRRVITRSAKEADKCGHREITPGHLLLGILEVKESLAARVLEGRGVTKLAILQVLTA
jgi:ATP-dependent Clp protease ATP-binding subunit ClpC